MRKHVCPATFYLSAVSYLEKNVKVCTKPLHIMARQPIWHDEYWLMLIQIYMKKPVGVKPIYSRELVQLGMELHIHPQYLHRMMTKLDEVESPSVKALKDSYAHNPKKIRTRVETLRLMKGFGNEQSV